MSRTCFVSPNRGWGDWRKFTGTGTIDTSELYTWLEQKNGEITITLNGLLPLAGFVANKECCYNIDSENVFNEDVFGLYPLASTNILLGPSGVGMLVGVYLKRYDTGKYLFYLNFVSLEAITAGEFGFSGDTFKLN